MDRLINIDNGGTLTDIVVGSGKDFTFTKTLTTPVDLSQCLFDGITKVSAEVFGQENLPALLHSTRHIRYSSTQGTNALVERKGPRIGLIAHDQALVDQLKSTPESAEMFEALIDDRIAIIERTQDDEATANAFVAEINRLTTAGAERLLIAGASKEDERFFQRVMLKTFPRHLLGSVPALFSLNFAPDVSRTRQIWSGVLNSFLHPTVERFLYSTEHRLRAHKVKNPLLIYRNDGASSRVAKSVALKTYSSGPRGGLEGTRALAEAYGLDNVIMIDVGGTTTDVGVVNKHEIVAHRRGSVGGVEISFEMSDVLSAGVGGSSVITVADGEIVVGPESVGAAPGPACFGFGGQQATITDVNLLLGVLDPATYLGGEMRLDAGRAEAVIRASIAEPLGISVEEALIRMESAYTQKMARTFADIVGDPASTTVAAFGGGGPMGACAAARAAGVRQVLVPKLAAVFSAYGISFSDISQSYEADITGLGDQEIAEIRSSLETSARRDMFQEGYRLDDCELQWNLVIEGARGTESSVTDFTGEVPSDLEEGHVLTLVLKATYRLPHPQVEGRGAAPSSPAVVSARRQVRSGATQVDDVPVFVLEEQVPGSTAEGPGVIEGPFFTARVPQGWSFEVTSSQDLLLTDQQQ